MPKGHLGSRGSARCCLQGEGTRWPQHTSYALPIPGSSWPRFVGLLSGVVTSTPPSHSLQSVNGPQRWAQPPQLRFHLPASSSCDSTPRLRRARVLRRSCRSFLKANRVKNPYGFLNLHARQWRCSTRLRLTFRALQVPATGSCGPKGWQLLLARPY